MIVFDGIYHLHGAVDPQARLSGNYAYAWRIRIINFSTLQPDVKYIKPFSVVASPSGTGIFKSNCADAIGKNICRDFNLDINKTLWIENLSDRPDQKYVAVFKPKSFFQAEQYYHINWRPIRPNEQDAITPFIS